jgi:hypothetical protein
MRYFVGMGTGKMSGVMGKAGKPRSLARGLMLKNAGACSSAPTTATGTMGVFDSRANRIKPNPNS